MPKTKVASNISKIINKLHGIDKQKPLVEGIDYTIDSKGESVEPLSPEFVAVMKKRAKKLAKNKGIEDMMDNPIMSATTPNVFSKNPARGAQPKDQESAPQEPEEPEDSNKDDSTEKKSDSEPKPEKEEKKTLKKDPLITSIGPGDQKQVKTGDSASDILGKIFNKYQEDYEWETKRAKKDKKYRKQIDDQKERFLDETVEALTGNKPSAIKRMIRKAKKSGFLKYGLMGAGAVGSFFLAEKALANVDWKSLLPDLSSIGGMDLSKLVSGDSTDFQNLIGKESGQNYDKLVNTNGPEVNKDKKLTEMKVSEVYNLQDEMKAKGYPSTAVGKYQITKDTLQGWMKQENLNPETTTFNKETQDRLLNRGLINAGSEKYQQSEKTQEDKDKFQIGLAKTWAAIPVPKDMEVSDNYGSRSLKKGDSYYKGVGNNKALISQSEVDSIMQKSSAMVSPVKGMNITSDFGPRINPNTGKHQDHHGLDLRGSEGQTVVSAERGKVLSVSDSPSTGTKVVIDHGNNKTTSYNHLKNPTISSGDTVEAGQKIGELAPKLAGTTAPHLHFEVMQNGKFVDPKQYNFGEKIPRMANEEQKTEIGSLPKKPTRKSDVNLSVLNKATTIIGGSTTNQVSSSDQQVDSKLFEKQYG